MNGREQFEDNESKVEEEGKKGEGGGEESITTGRTTPHYRRFLSFCRQDRRPRRIRSGIISTCQHLNSALRPSSLMAGEATPLYHHTVLNSPVSCVYFLFLPMRSRRINFV